MSRSYVGVYGNVALRKTYCEDCRTRCIVLKGVKQCCDKPCRERPSKFKIECEALDKREGLSRLAKRRKLIAQEGRCFYCDYSLDGHIIRNGNAIKLRTHWDHFVPFCYSANNSSDNFVAACHVCNSIKSSLFFETADDARIYIETIKKSKGYV